MEPVGFENSAIQPMHEGDNEQLRRQFEELTKQLNESQLAVKQANDEHEKYVFQTNERLQAFEQQLRRISNILIPDASEQSLTNSTDSNDVLQQVSELIDNLEKSVSQYSDENNQLSLADSQNQEEAIQLQSDFSLLQAEYQKEQQMRHHFEKQFNEANKLIEMDHSKRLQKLRNYATLADDEGDILLSSLMKKAEKNDIDLREIKFQYESMFLEQVNQIKKLIKEREILHLYIQRLEHENALLSSRTYNDEAIRFLTYSSQTPTSPEECLVLVQQLREVIIEQLKIQDKLRNDTDQVVSNHQTDIREREQIEELIHRDLTTAKDQILVLESVRSEYEHVLKLKNNLQRELDECKNELDTLRGVANSLIDNLKEQTENISLEKERLEEENVILRDQMQKLKVDFENSESVQHDFVKLSQALQVQLEEFRNSGNEVRWQHDEDFTECQRCHLQFSMTWRKQHCCHCGKVLCKECVNKTVSSGPNHRLARVCNVCYTLLNKTSQPYFLAGVPQV